MARRYLIFIAIAFFCIILGFPIVHATTPELHEGDLISSFSFDGDPDVFIINGHGYKRLFLNPEIFGFYGHLRYTQIKQVLPAIKDQYTSANFYRNCQANDSSVYALQTDAEDTGTLHHINLSAQEVLNQDSAFFQKVFCINTREFSWYTKATPYNSLTSVVLYKRIIPPTPSLPPLIQDDGTIIISGITESDVGLIDRETIIDRKVAEKFYASHPDIYDFLVIYTAFQPKTQTPSNYVIKNVIRGIGFPIAETFPPYPSERLQQTIFMADIDNLNVVDPWPHYKILFEEISHRWLMFIGDVRDCRDPQAEPCKRNTGFKINRDGAHWDANVDSLVRENGKIYSPPQTASGNPWSEDKGFCTLLYANVSPKVRFNDLELYLMGLVPPQDVKSIPWYELGEWNAQGQRPCTKKLLTANDVINMVGQRTPVYPNTQRDFSVGFILVTKKDQIPSQLQIDKMNFLIDDFPRKWREATRYTSTLQIP